MKKKQNTMGRAIDDIFESNEKKSLKEIYKYVVECGFEDKGDITKHSIRGIIHKMTKTGKIIHISKGVYIKAGNASNNLNSGHLTSGRSGIKHPAS